MKRSDKGCDCCEQKVPETIVLEERSIEKCNTADALQHQKTKNQKTQQPVREQPGHIEIF